MLHKVLPGLALPRTSTAHRFNKGTFGDVSLTDTFDSLSDKVAAFEKGDHSQQRAMLIGQSLALNAIFTELARRAAANMGEYINASERYMRLALKAQAQSRATVEALERITNGREQTVRHVHVDNRGGQAVIAETVQTGGATNWTIKRTTPCARKRHAFRPRPGVGRKRGAGRHADRQRCRTGGVGCTVALPRARPRATGTRGSMGLGRHTRKALRRSSGR